MPPTIKHDTAANNKKEYVHKRAPDKMFTMIMSCATKWLHNMCSHTIYFMLTKKPGDELTD